MDAPRSDESSALISQLREEVAYLREENLRKDHIIAGLVERIPPAIETSSEARESPESATEQPGRVGPQPAVESAQGGAEPRSWWRRMFGG